MLIYDKSTMNNIADIAKRESAKELFHQSLSLGPETTLATIAQPNAQGEFPMGVCGVLGWYNGIS